MDIAIGWLPATYPRLGVAVNFVNLGRDRMADRRGPARRTADRTTHPHRRIRQGADSVALPIALSRPVLVAPRPPAKRSRNHPPHRVARSGRFPNVPAPPRGPVSSSPASRARHNANRLAPSCPPATHKQNRSRPDRARRRWPAEARTAPPSARRTASSPGQRGRRTDNR